MDNLYIRIPANGGLWQGWHVKGLDVVTLFDSDLEAIMATGAANMRVTLLVPTTSCVMAVVNVTKQQLKQIDSQNVAYLLEDQTLTPVEQLHCLYAPMSDTQALVVAIHQQHMQSLIEPFKNTACELVAAVPDIFLLPHNPQGWSLMVDGSDCWLRMNALFGMRLEADSALAVLNSAWHEQPPTQVKIYGEIPNELNTWLTAKGAALTVEQLPSLNWAQEFSHMTAKHPFNFLQGKFAVKTKSSLSGYWRYAAIFVGITFAVQLAYDATRIFQYNRVVKTTKAESVKLYQTLFPDERRVVNLRRQIESHLSERQSAGQGFVSVATKVGEVLNSGSWQTQRLDFDNNGLLLEVDALSLSDLEQLRQQLTNQGLTTETLSANSQGTGIRGRLRISESS
ncbi:MAG: hypothetical protein RJA86_962 [Pseudomonadota bacterium]|jgi:general secretion pathway protein L